MSETRVSILPKALGIVVLAGLAYGGYRLLVSGDSTSPLAEPPIVERPEDAPTPPPLQAVVEALPPAVLEPNAPRIVYPDGNVAAPLNGVNEDVRLKWTPGRPYSPIVEKVTHKGWEWYRHEDGTFSTTYRIAINGVTQAAGFVAAPTAPRPVEGVERPPGPKE